MKLRIEEELFSGLRMRFNVSLQDMFRKMEKSGMDEGTVSVKLDVKLEEEMIGGGFRKGEIVNMPKFSYKVTSSVPVKAEQKGGEAPQAELVKDDRTKEYELEEVSLSGQISIHDYMKEREA